MASLRLHIPILDLRVSHAYKASLARLGVSLTNNIDDADAVLARINDFRRFLADHPERMKYPDTPAAV
jgi:hypothetical protein